MKSVNGTSLAGRPSVSRWFSVMACEGAVRASRLWARIVLLEFGQEHKSDDAALVISELVTNAARITPGKVIRVRILLDGNDIVLTVWDSDSGIPRVNDDVLADLENDDPDDNGGRGLFLVAEVTKDWGYDPTPVTGGKWTWARL